MLFLLAIKQLQWRILSWNISHLLPALCWFCPFRAWPSLTAPVHRAMWKRIRVNVKGFPKRSPVFSRHTLSPPGRRIWIPWSTRSMPCLRKCKTSWKIRIVWSPGRMGSLFVIWVKPSISFRIWSPRRWGMHLTTPTSWMSWRLFRRGWTSEWSAWTITTLVRVSLPTLFASPAKVPVSFRWNSTTANRWMPAMSWAPICESTRTWKTMPWWPCSPCPVLPVSGGPMAMAAWFVVNPLRSSAGWIMQWMSPAHDGPLSVFTISVPRTGVGWRTARSMKTNAT